jgi:hypothetical protein
MKRRSDLMSQASHRRNDSNDNERRADTALHAVSAGTDCEFRRDGISGLETDVEDLLANIRHLCDRFGLDYGDRDAAAHRAYIGDFEDGERVGRTQNPPMDPPGPGGQCGSPAAVRGSDPKELALARLLVDTAFGIGGLSDDYCLSTAMVDDEVAVVFCERTTEGLSPLAEIHPARDGYSAVGDEAGMEKETQRSTERDVTELVALADRLKLPECALDEAVYDSEAPSASSLNNQGIEAQLRWLLSVNDVGTVRGLIQEAAESEPEEG